MAAVESADCGLEEARPLSVRCDLSHLHSLERHRGRHRCLCVLAHGMAACSDSKMGIVSPLLSFSVQYPVTNPGSCETRGTSCSCSARSAACGSLIVTLTTTACMRFLHGRWVVGGVRALNCCGSARGLR